MYMPYLNARYLEHEALSKIIDLIDSSFVIPIIEHIYDNSINELHKIVELFSSNNKKFILIKNISDEEIFFMEKNIPNFNNMCMLGVFKQDFHDSAKFQLEIAIIHDDTNKFNPTHNLNIFLPHVARIDTYTRLYRHKVILSDATYIPYSHTYDLRTINTSTFSDIVFTYKEKGLYGFGDRIILNSQDIQPMGANINFINSTLHLSFIQDDIIKIRHFNVTPQEEPNNTMRTQRVLYDALSEISYFMQTRAFSLIEEKSHRGTSLSILKQISIMHHIEFMTNLTRQHQ